MEQSKTPLSQLQQLTGPSFTKAQSSQPVKTPCTEVPDSPAGQSDFESESPRNGYSVPAAVVSAPPGISPSPRKSAVKSHERDSGACKDCPMAMPPPGMSPLAPQRESVQSVLLVDTSCTRDDIKNALGEVYTQCSIAPSYGYSDRTLHFVYCSDSAVATVASKNLETAQLAHVTYQDWYVCVMDNTFTDEVRALAHADTEFRPHVRICPYDKSSKSAHIGRPTDDLLATSNLWRVMVWGEKIGQVVQKALGNDSYKFVGPFTFCAASGHRLKELSQAVVQETPAHARRTSNISHPRRSSNTSHPRSNTSHPRRSSDTSAPQKNNDAEHGPWWPTVSQTDTPTEDWTEEQTRAWWSMISPWHHTHDDNEEAPVLHENQLATHLAQRAAATELRDHRTTNVSAFPGTSEGMYDWEQHQLYAWNSEVSMPTPPGLFSYQAAQPWEDKWERKYGKDGAKKRNPNHPIPPPGGSMKGKKGERVTAACHPKYTELTTTAYARRSPPWMTKGGAPSNPAWGYGKGQPLVESDWNMQPTENFGGGWNAWAAWASYTSCENWSNTWDPEAKGKGKGKLWRGPWEDGRCATDRRAW